MKVSLGCYTEAGNLAPRVDWVLDHLPIVISDPIGALARLQLGRAFVLSGDTAKGKAAYRDFLELWKDADIPILKQAKAEFAKL